MATETKPAKRGPEIKEYTFAWTGKNKAGKVVRGEMRAGSEAVVNAIKHARPQRIDIALDCRPGREEKTIVLCVRDDGCGRAQGRVPADEDAPGLGLRIMSHRAQMVGGEFHIDDAPGGGTRITCRIPCQPQPEHAAAPNPAA